MMRIAHFVTLSEGWKRSLIALVSGASGALALSPIDLFPAMIIPLVVAVWLIDGSVHAKGTGALRRLSTIGNIATAGWWLGFGYFVAGLWWLGAAFFVEADKFLWALPLAVLGLPAVLALFPAVGFVIASVMWSSGAGRIFALAVGLSATEWLRGVILTGFPWNSFGMALGGNLLFAQLGSIVGLNGLTLLTVAIFSSPATLADVGKTASGRSRLRSPTMVAILTVVAMSLFGGWRLLTGQTQFEADVKLRIMQPNLPQDEKFRPENKEQILGRYLSLSDRATSPETSGVNDVTHLIWPESAFPFILSQDSQTLGRLGAMLGTKTILITGAARTAATSKGARLPGESNVIYHNSIHVIGANGVILDTYDKVHLVPFGEYLPFSRFLEKLGVRHFVHIPGGFDPGGMRRLLAVPKLPPVAPLVCYEAIFTGEVTPEDGNSTRPGLMLNVTNDAWFGKTSGPYQHLAQARLRSIEEGLPLIRAANSGISAVIDPYGRVLKYLPLGTEGVLDSALPKAIPAPIFARFHGRGFLLLFMFMFGAAFFCKISRAKMAAHVYP